VGSQNLTNFQTFVQYGLATQFSEIVHNLTSFLTRLTEPKCYFSELRYALSNYMVYFSPHALFSQVWSQLFWHNVQGYVIQEKNDPLTG